MQLVAGLRANRLTRPKSVVTDFDQWFGEVRNIGLRLAAAAWKPERPGGFALISAPPVLTVAPLRSATVRLISDQIRLGRMVPFQVIML